MKRIKMEKGITLIALIITIVILMLLASVAISSIKNEGILSKSNDVASEFEITQEREDLYKEVLIWKMNEEGTLVDHLIGKYGEDNVLPNGDGTITVEVPSHRRYNVIDDGKPEQETITPTVTPTPDPTPVTPTPVTPTPVTPIVGQYVKYDVGYTDMYTGIEFNNNAEGKYGWRYLGTDEAGNHLIISTGIPMMLKHFWSTGGNSKKWWGEGTQVNEKAVNGLMRNLAMIPYTKVSLGTIETDDTEENKHKMIGLFDGTTRGSGDSAYVAVGDHFKAEGQSYSGKIEHVRTLTYEEVIRALYNARRIKGIQETESDLRNRINTEKNGFANILNAIGSNDVAYGLIELARIGIKAADENAYPNKYFYWVAGTVPIFNVENGLDAVYYNSETEPKVPILGGLNARDCGVRPVIVLSGVSFTDANGDGVLEIN